MIEKFKNQCKQLHLIKKYCVYIDVVNTEEPIEQRASYVGCGNEARIRLFRRNKHHNNIVKKYGMTRIVIDEFDDFEQTRQHEIMLIDEKRTCTLVVDHTKYACNYTFGGEGKLGMSYVRTDEILEKLSNSQKIRYQNPAAHHVLCEAQQVRWQDPNEHKKMSDSKKQQFDNDPNARKKISDTTRAAMHREDVIKKIRESNDNPDVKKRKSDAQRKRFEDPEQHKNIKIRRIDDSELVNILKLRNEKKLSWYQIANLYQCSRCAIQNVVHRNNADDKVIHKKRFQS